MGKAFTTIGTSGVVFAHTSDIAIDPKGRVHTFCCAVPGAWHVMGVTQGAGLSFEMVSGSVLRRRDRNGEINGVDPYYLMDQEAQTVPIGANRLLYLPYLMGERTPHLDPNARGAFFGLSAIHTKKTCFAGSDGGVSYSLQDCLVCSAKWESPPTICWLAAEEEAVRSGEKCLPICMVARSRRCPSKEGPALGVALLAGVGAGIYGSVQEACSAVIRVDKEVQPEQANHLRYQKFISYIGNYILP